MSILKTVVGLHSCLLRLPLSAFATYYEVRLLIVSETIRICGGPLMSLYWPAPPTGKNRTDVKCIRYKNWFLFDSCVIVNLPQHQNTRTPTLRSNGGGILCVNIIWSTGFSHHVLHY